MSGFDPLQSMGGIPGLTPGSSSGLVLSVPIAQDYGTLAASGTSQANAPTLADQQTLVTSRSGSGYIKLPASRPAGEVWTVRYKDGNTGQGSTNIFVYSPVGGTMSNGGAASSNGGRYVYDGGTAAFRCLGSDAWEALGNTLIPYATQQEAIATDILRIILSTGIIMSSDTNSIGLQAGTTNALFKRLNYKRVVTPKTADYTLTDNAQTTGDCGTLFTNEGAAGQVIFTLPTAAANLYYGFYVQTAQNIRIVAASGDTIRTASGVSAAAGRTDNATAGSILWLTAINATEWVADRQTGTWAVT